MRWTALTRALTRSHYRIRAFLIITSHVPYFLRTPILRFVNQDTHTRVCMRVYVKRTWSSTQLFSSSFTFLSRTSRYEIKVERYSSTVAGKYNTGLVSWSNQTEGSGDRGRNWHPNIPISMAEWSGRPKGTILQWRVSRLVFEFHCDMNVSPWGCRRISIGMRC